MYNTWGRNKQKWVKKLNTFIFSIFSENAQHKKIKLRKLSYLHFTKFIIKRGRVHLVFDWSDEGTMRGQQL